jgi:hypothetical protein
MTAIIRPTSRFKEMIVKRFSVRMHMFVIITAVITFGLVLSKILLLAGLTNLVYRYTAVLFVSYGFFFIAIRVWLFYVLPSFRKKDSSSTESLDGVVISAINIPSGGSSGDVSFSGSGGQFGGGGTSGSWNSSGAPAIVALNDASAQGSSAGSASISGSGSSSGSGFSLGDLDTDSAGALVIFLIFIVIAAMLGGAIYIIYQAPVIMSEAAFNALLSGGMIRAAKKMHSEDWTGSVFKATWKPFVLIAGITITAAAILTYVFPGETNIGDIVRHTLLK